MTSPPAPGLKTNTQLKTNNQLTREIDRLTTELHQRLMGEATR